MIDAFTSLLSGTVTVPTSGLEGSTASEEQVCRLLAPLLLESLLWIDVVASRAILLTSVRTNAFDLFVVLSR